MVTPTVNVKAGEFSITQADTNCTLTTGTVALMTDIAVYKVPRHTAILIRPSDTISGYFKDNAAEMLATDTVQILVRDPNGITSEILAAGIYAQFKEFQDQNKTKKFGRNRMITSDFQLVIQAKATTVLVVANCYWVITCLRYAQTL